MKNSGAEGNTLFKCRVFLKKNYIFNCLGEKTLEACFKEAVSLGCIVKYLEQRSLKKMDFLAL